MESSIRTNINRILENISEKSQKEQLEQIAKKYFHEDITVKISAIEVDKPSMNAGNGRNKTNNLNDIKREAINNPLLQKVMDEFAGAEIVEIKPLCKNNLLK